jgi:hypothetical protein
MSNIVREYSTVIEGLGLYAEELQASFQTRWFGSVRFVLRDLTECGVMELLVDSTCPRPVAEELLRLVREASARTVPGLSCALAVPALNGGRWAKGAALYEAEGDADRELVLVDWLEASLAAGTDLAVGRRRILTSNEARVHFWLWLSSTADGTVWFMHLCTCDISTQNILGSSTSKKNCGMQSATIHTPTCANFQSVAGSPCRSLPR